MTQSLASEQPSKGRLWAGRVLSGLVVLLLLASASMKLKHGPDVVQGFTKYGYPEGVILPLGLAELTCALLYALPWTSGLGAVLLTGYLGGAVATHVRAGEPFLAAILVGVVAWLGLYLRDRRVGVLIPGKR